MQEEVLLARKLQMVPPTVAGFKNAFFITLRLNIRLNREVIRVIFIQSKPFNSFSTLHLLLSLRALKFCTLNIFCSFLIKKSQLKLINGMEML